MSLWTVIRTGKAWDEIGWDAGPFRIKGGRAIYQAVMYCCATARSNRVKLARLGNYVGTQAIGLEEISQRVHPDTVLEFLKPKDSK